MRLSAPFRLQLFEDRLGPGARLELAALNRVLYAVEGSADIERFTGGSAAALAAGSACYGAAGCGVESPRGAARLWRFELVPPTSAVTAGAGQGGSSRLLLAHAIALDPAGEYLMRCDRVEFEPGGEAPPHGHRGGGIRCLLAGELEVRVGGRPGRVMRPGEAWFEDGIEPVHALAAPGSATSFVRVAILPREIRGQTSIVYVDSSSSSAASQASSSAASHVSGSAAAARPRRYTVWVDEPIELAVGRPA